jgi:hypothetical protein
MKKLIIYYNFILITIITCIGFLQAESVAQVVSAVLFFPLVIYFGQFIFPHKQKALPNMPPPVTESDEETLKENIPVQEDLKPEHEELEKSHETQKETDTVKEEVPIEEAPTEEALEGKVVAKSFDLDRRMFLKLIGSAGMTLFLFSIFTKKAEGAFFGSVPGPGTLSIKDTTGAKIDPAIKQPTDGYNIAQVDDSTSTTYYGYLNKDGAWYILREDSSSNYRYCKGSSSFSTNWTSRASLTYDYFDAVF